MKYTTEVDKLRAEIERRRTDNHKLMLWNEELQVKVDEVAAFLNRLADSMATPEGFFVESVVRNCRAMARKLRGETE